jgi:hypothetical protein
VSRKPDVRALELLLAQLVNEADGETLDRLGVRLLVCADELRDDPAERRAYARAHALLNARRAVSALVKQDRTPRALTLVHDASLIESSYGVARILDDGRRIVVSIHDSAYEANAAHERMTLVASPAVLFSVVHRIGGYRVGDSWDGGSP